MGMDASGERLIEALRVADLAGARALVEMGCDVNWADPGTGYTALHWAADRGEAGFAHELLANGARADLREAEGLTPLMLAVSKQDLACVKALLPRSDLGQKDMMQETAEEKAGILLALSHASTLLGLRAALALPIFEAIRSEPSRRLALSQAQDLREHTELPGAPRADQANLAPVASKPKPRM